MPVAQIQNPNRLLDAIQYYLQEEQTLYANKGNIGVITQKNELLKIQFYEQLLSTLKEKLSNEEKATRVFIQTDLKRLKFRTDRSLLSFIANNPLSRIIVLLVNEQRDQFKKMDAIVSQYTKNVAIDSSIIRLNNQLQQSGFSKNMDAQLRKMMNVGLDKFHLRYFDLKHPETDYVLYFSKVPGTNNYQFNSFEAAAVPAWMNQNSKAEYFRFDLDNESRLSASQASTLLTGGALATDYNHDHWIVMDRTDPFNPFKVVTFDLESALKDFPLPPMDDVERNQLLQVLRAGGEKELQYIVNNSSMTYSLRANPLTNTLNLHDHLNRYISPHTVDAKTSSTVENIMMNQSNTLQKNYAPRLSSV